MADIKPDFTLDELQDFLGLAEAPNMEGYRSSIEWAEYLGIGVARMGDLLRAANRRAAVRVQRQFRTGVDGRRFPTPVYAFRLGGE